MQLNKALIRPFNRVPMLNDMLCKLAGVMHLMLIDANSNITI